MAGETPAGQPARRRRYKLEDTAPLKRLQFRVNLCRFVVLQAQRGDYSRDLGKCLIPLTMELNCGRQSVPAQPGASVLMSNLAGLRVKLRAGGKRTLLYVVAALLLVGMAGWLLVSRPGGSQARNQPSALRRVAQRTASPPPTPKLQISDIRQTGQVVELKGTAECDAAVMINGEHVPLIFDHCGFKHFILLPEGPSTIAVTAQGPAGGVNTQMIKVNIE